MLDLAKTLPVLRLTTHKPILSVDAVVGVELLATTLAGKDMATVLPNFVLARHLHRLESFVTDITWVNPLSLSCVLSPYTDPIQQQHDFPHKPALKTCRFRCQHMSTPLHVLLKADPCLEGEVEVTKPILWCAYNLTGYLSCSIFQKWLAPWTNNMCLDRLFFCLKFLPHWLHYSGKQRRVASGR